MTTPADAPGYLGRILTPTSTPDNRVGVGTCFQVSPGLLVTAWHVLDDLGLAQPDAEILIDQLDSAASTAAPMVLARVHAMDPLRDLAILIASAGGLRTSVKGLVATDTITSGVGIAVSGVAAVPGEDLLYSSASGTWEGPAMRSDQVALGVLKASGIAKGMSGGPVRRQHDDHIVGVVSGRYNSADGWQEHQVWVVRIEDLLPLLPDLAQVPVADALPRGAPVDLALTVSDTVVRLTGPGVDVQVLHQGVRDGLRNALHDVRRERTSRGRLDTKLETSLDAKTDAQPGQAVQVHGVGVLSLRHSGQLLAESFLSDPVAQALDGLLRRAEQTSAPVRLAIDAPSLTMLPWEALPDPTTTQPLALHPLVYLYRQSKAAAVPAVLPGPLRIVVAIASPDTGGGPLLDYERELGAVLNAVRGARQDDAYVEVVPFATTAAIRAALDRGGVHVLHISAHGAPGVLHLEDDQGNARPVTPDDFLTEAIPPGKMPPVISLAACYTDTTGEEQGGSYAAQLAARGACAVIATQTSVTDAYATRLFARVYAELAATDHPDVIRAVGDARRRVQLDLARATQPLDQLLAGMDEWSIVTILATSPQVDVVDPTTTTPVPGPAVAVDLGGLLARPVGQFVGRRRQQRHLPTLLQGDAYGGVLLHGIGGIGKTTLAAEVIRRATERSGSWRVVTLTGPLSVDGILAALAGVLRRDLLLRQITHGPQATAIQVAGRVEVPWQDRLGLLRTEVLAEVPVLLVLDNFEDNLTQTPDGGTPATDGVWQVADPGVAGLLAAWLADPGRSRLLVTSRYPFTLPGRAADRLFGFQVPPLSLAETRKLLWSLPNLDRYAIDTDAQEKIWRQVGGHPRSLEYLDALLGGGQGRFPDITSRLHDAVVKRLNPGETAAWLTQNRTLEAAIAQAATLAADDVLLTTHLNQLAQVEGAVRLLAGISVYREPVDHNALLFQTGTPNPAAAYTPDRQHLVEQITTLLATHDLALDDLPAVLGGGGPLSPAERDHLHHLFNRYQHEAPRPPVDPPTGLPSLLGRLIGTSLITQVGDRVVMHPWTATELQRHWTDPASPHVQPQMVTQAHRAAAEYWQWRVETLPQDSIADVHDLTEARHHLNAAGDLEAASTLTEQICRQLDRWGAWDQETSLIHDTLRWLPKHSPRRPAYYHQLGILAQNRGDYEEAKRRYQQALTISEDLGNRSDVANVYGQMGVLAYLQADYPQAERRYQQALTIFENLGNRSGMAGVYHQLGRLAQDRGDYPEAERRFRQSLSIEEELGNRSGTAASHHQLGILAQDRGDYREAERRFRQSLSIEEELGNRSGAAASYHDLGNLAYLQADHLEAERLYQRSLTIKVDLGDRAGAANTYGQLGMLAMTRGDYPEANRRYQQALAVFEELGNRASMATVYHQLGILAYLQGDYPQAEPRHRQALTIFEELGNRASMATVYHSLGRLARIRGDNAEAERHYQQSLTINEDLGNQAGAARAISELGLLNSQTGRSREAVLLHCSALAIRLQLGIPGAGIDVDRLHALRAELGSETFDEITKARLDEQARRSLLAILDALVDEHGEEDPE